MGYRDEGYDYLIASSFIYDLHLVDRDRDKERTTFYASLDSLYRLIKEFRPYRGEIRPSFAFDDIYGPWLSLFEVDRPGPTIKIYRIGC